MTNTPQHNLLQADLQRRAAKKASRLRLAKTLLAAAAASLSVTVAVSQLQPAAKLSFARMDSSATLHRPPPLGSTNDAPASTADQMAASVPSGHIGNGNTIPSNGQVLGLSTTTQPNTPAALSLA